MNARDFNANASPTIQHISEFTSVTFKCVCSIFMKTDIPYFISYSLASHNHAFQHTKDSKDECTVNE